MTYKKLSAIELKSLRYQLFHYAPRVLSLSATNGDDMLAPFLQWAAAHGLSMGWTMPIYFLHWLYAQEKWRSQMTVEMAKELLMASVTRWSMNGLEHITARGMMVTFAQQPGLAVGLWKSQAPDQAGKIVVMHLAEGSHPKVDSYAISYQQGSWEAAKWLALPL